MDLSGVGGQNQVADTSSRSANDPADRLDSGERAQLQELQARDREVRAHEQAHRVAAGNLVRGTTHFDYETGPDGRRYAVGGEVDIDTSREQDPAKSLDKAERIIRAATAPAEPSPQDARAAAQARAMAAEARAELERAEREETARPTDARPGSLFDVVA